MHLRPALGCILAFLVTPSVLFAQGQPPSDPKAVAFAAQSIAALTGGTSISDVTLTGTVTWYGSGTETGTATLRALGTGESRMDLTLTNGVRTEIRDTQTGTPLGQWTNPNNTLGYSASQNCWTDAVWFFPALGSLFSRPNVVLSYIGQETWNGATVQHVQSYLYVSGKFRSPTPQQLSTMDFYLDAKTFLPTAITFNAHPDNDSGTNLPVEVDFSNYQDIGGVFVPMRIQKYQQGNLMADIVLSEASFNTGLSLSIFAVD